MSKNLEKCLRAFDRGEAHGERPRSPTGGKAWCGRFGFRNPCWTDGKKIFSYDMPIVWRDENGDVILAKEGDTVRPDGGGRGGISMTTRGHIRQCRMHAFVPTDKLIVIAQDMVRETGGRAA